jgi:hypothetical protein
MQGAEANRAAPKYQADRALFLLLLTAPYRLRRPSGLDVMASQGHFASDAERPGTHQGSNTERPSRFHPAWPAAPTSARRGTCDEVPPL